MDPKNLFFTPRTALLMRLDYLSILAVSLYALAMQFDSLNLRHFLFAIVWQDLIGYYPAAALYYRPGRDKAARTIPRYFYRLYNVVHGIPFNLFVLVVWWHAHGGWEPAMLAIPIHLSIDRGVFGRYYKSFLIAFEPVQHPLFADFDRRLRECPEWGG